MALLLAAIVTLLVVLTFGAADGLLGAAKSLPTNSPDRLKYKMNLTALHAKLANASTSPQPATVITTR